MIMMNRLRLSQHSNRLGLPGLTRIAGINLGRCIVLWDDGLGHLSRYWSVLEAACLVSMPWLQTNMALYVFIGPGPGQGCWVSLHESLRDQVLDSTQRRRAVQRAPRASCHLRGACCAHLSLRCVSKLSLLLHINKSHGPCRSSNNKEKRSGNDVRIW